MPRNALTRRAMLQMTTGAAIAAPLALTAPDTVAHRLTPADTVAHLGPVRRIEGTLIVSDRSAVPSPIRPSSCSQISLEIGQDGRGVLSLSYFDGTPDDVVPLPAETARALDRALFGGEREGERQRREKREAGWIDCPLYHYKGRCHPGLCDEDGLIHPSTVSRHLGPWFTARDVAAELHRVPAAWGPVVDSYGYWYGPVAERLRGTSEDGRVESVILQLHGLGWGAEYTPEGDEPDGPTIDLWPTHGTHHHPIDPDHPVEWCAYLPGDPVHGACDTIGEALDQAVASLAGRLASLIVAAAIDRAPGDGLALAA